MRKLRVGIFSDTHCGSLLGLTPPGWFPSKMGKATKALSDKAWSFFLAGLKATGPFDVAVHLGDAIDGKQKKSGGVGLLFSDMAKQVEMAAEVVEVIGADRNIFIEGTGYHVNADGQNMERELAKKFDEDISTERMVKINNTQFYFRHKVPTSEVPHGRHTPVSRMHLWNMLKAAKGVVPLADVMVFGHTHYFAGAVGAGWSAMTAPALQVSSNFGQTQCNGDIDWGFIGFDVDADRALLWQYIVPIELPMDKTIIKG